MTKIDTGRYQITLKIEKDGQEIKKEVEFKLVYILANSAHVKGPGPLPGGGEGFRPGG